ncbi:MAG: hypothetical protein NTZ43_11250 [Gemmatimonadetes bacterium]|nr:hypothetical protein [Gemmatimonadota bacterium]
MTESLAPGFAEREAFASIAEDYATLRERAACIDRSARLRLLFSGAKARDTLNGLITNDVGSLADGSGIYAAALTAKGKIITDLRVFARSDDFLVDAPAAGAFALLTMFRKYVNPRMARFADVSVVLRTIGVFGPHSANIVTAATGAERGQLLLLGPYHHLRVASEGGDVVIARVPDLGGEGFDLFVPVEHAAEWWKRITEAGADPIGTAATEIARVEAGRPLIGTDMDENTLVQEANFDVLHGISYTKGCYTGQETVARVHFRGHVNRQLRGVRASVPLTIGASLLREDRESVGAVGSVAASPRYGSIALAMVRREVETGAELRVGPVEGEATDAGDLIEARVRVVELPFG